MLRAPPLTTATLPASLPSGTAISPLLPVPSKSRPPTRLPQDATRPIDGKLLHCALSCTTAIRDHNEARTMRMRTVPIPQPNTRLIFLADRAPLARGHGIHRLDRKSTRLNSSH